MKLWDYDVYEACSAVVHVHKKILSWGDTYVIEYNESEKGIPALLLMLAIDAANCSPNNNVDNIQYELIRKQFDCMADYLSWDMLFQKSYYATTRDDLQKNMAALEELGNIGSKMK